MPSESNNITGGAFMAPEGDQMRSVNETDVDRLDSSAWPKAGHQPRKARESRLGLNEGTILCLSNTRQEQ